MLEELRIPLGITSQQLHGVAPHSIVWTEQHHTPGWPPAQKPHASLVAAAGQGSHVPQQAIDQPIILSAAHCHLIRIESLHQLVANREELVQHLHMLTMAW